MHQAQRSATAQTERLEALRQKHTALDRKVKEVQRRPSVSDFEIHVLKAEKLKIKDEMELLKEAS